MSKLLEQIQQLTDKGYYVEFDAVKVGELPMLRCTLKKEFGHGRMAHQKYKTVLTERQYQCRVSWETRVIDSLLMCEQHMLKADNAN